jgi:hypothetical protein
VKVGIHANIADQDTKALADALTSVFDAMARELDGDYGGLIEHLWIDVELLEYLAKLDGGPRHPFRFQKRVSGRSRFGLPATQDTFNVGHFSVRPDLELLGSLRLEDAVCHVLQRIFDQSAILLEKQKQLGDFNANQFRQRLLTVCQQRGCLGLTESC